MLDILVLADDLTGALEAGAALRQNGIDVMVILDEEGDREMVSGLRALVVDTETRYLPETQAAATVLKLARKYPAQRLYKKTDSTLRGNIRAELDALSRIGPVMYVPAYPRLGRMVVNKCLHIDGVPLEQTAFARDSNLARMLIGTQRIHICEANTDSEIQSAAREWLTHGVIAAGPGAFLHAIAELSKDNSAVAPEFPIIQRCLVVVGSRHEQSRLQIATCRLALEPAGWRIIVSPDDDVDDAGQHASDFAAIVARELPSQPYDTLIVFGGDTAFAVLKAIQVSRVTPIGEILPGVPVSRLPNGLTLITKAGGFGPPDVLSQIRQRLTYARA